MMKSLICLVIASVILSVGSASESDDDFDRRCIRACPDIYAPVCGSDGENFRIFPSECVMESENCNLLFKSQRAFTKSPLRFCQPDEQFEEESDICPKVCPFIYKPVCAFYGKATKQFPNKCELRRAQCMFGEPWQQTSMDECKRDIFEDEESVDPKKKCLKACNLNWDPICGFDGENYFTFGNKCDMEVQTCLMSERRWTLVKKGQC